MKIVQLMILSLILISTSCKDKATAEPATVNKENAKTPDMNALYQHYYQNPENQDELDENALIDYIVDHDLSPKRSVTGLYYQIHESGTGENIKLGDKLEVHYIGKFLDDTEFDNSYNRGEPLKFALGKGLIQAWIEGLRYLNEGSKATLVVPSRLAYQDKGLGDLIAPNLPLVFEVEIVKVN